MVKRTLNLVVAAISSASLVLSSTPLPAQPATPDRDEAKAALAAVFLQIDDMRRRVDDSAFDPDAMAYALGDDPGALFDFVQNEIAYHPYPGLLRFGSGTLMNLAGNTCDQALLLGEMLDAAGETVRYASAPMTPEVQERLMALAHLPATALTAPAAFELPSFQDQNDLYWLGYSDEMIDEAVAESVFQTYAFSQELDSLFAISEELIGPQLDAALAGATRPARPVQQTHCWVQHQSGDNWRDLDPAAWWMPEGQAALTAAEVHAEGLPLDLAPTLSVVIEVERIRADGTPGTIRILDVSSSLFRQVNEFSLVVIPTLLEEGAPDPEGGHSAFSLMASLNGRTATSAPFDLSGNAPPPELAAPPSAMDVIGGTIDCLFGCPSEDPPPSEGGGGGLFGGGGLLGGGTPPPEPEAEADAEPETPELAQGLLGLTMTIGLTNAAGDTVTEQRVLASHHPGLDAEAALADLQRQMSQSYEAVIWGGRIETDYLNAVELDALLEARTTLEILLDAQGDEAPSHDIEALITDLDLPNVGLLEFARLRGALVEQAAMRDLGTQVHVGFPQMFAQRIGGLPEAGPSGFGQSFDILSNGLVVDGPDAALKHARFGIADTLIEYLGTGGGDAANFYRQLVAAVDAGAALGLRTAEDSEALAAADLDPTTRRMLADDLSRGYSILAPPRAQTIADSPRFAWLRIDPVTGETLGRGAHGGAAGSETAVVNAEPAQRAKWVTLLIHAGIAVGVCAAMHVATPYLSQASAWMANEPGGPLEDPRSPARQRADFILCLGLAVALTGAFTLVRIFGPRLAATLGIGSGAGLSAAARGSGRTPPPSGARPQSMPPRPSAQGGRYARVTPNSAPEVGQGTSGRPSGSRAGSGHSARPPEGRRSGSTIVDVPQGRRSGSTIVDQPARGTNPRSGASLDGNPGPQPPRNRPPNQRTPSENFDLVVETLFGRRAVASHDMSVARGRWHAMSPAQRRAAYDTFRRLQRADPLGHPQRQFQRAMETGHNPHASPAAQLANVAMDVGLAEGSAAPNLGIHLRSLAREAGVSPQQMRSLLEARFVERGGAPHRVQVGPDGFVRLIEPQPHYERLTPHERQLAEMSPQRNPRNAAEDARVRAAFDKERGLTLEESVAGQAHHNEVPPQEYLNRSGLTRAEGEAHVIRYLESRNLSPAQARAEAKAYFDQLPPETGSAAPRGPSRPPGDGPPPPGSQTPRGDRSTPPPERGARSPFESADRAPDQARYRPDQVRRANAEANRVALEPEQMSQMAASGETIRMTPAELRAVAERTDALRLTPEQQRLAADGAPSVPLTEGQVQQMARSGETVRMSPTELRAVAERSDTLRLTPDQRQQITNLEGAPPPARTPRPTAAQERRNPNLPPEREFQTAEAAERAQSPDGLLASERLRIEDLNRRIVDNQIEMVPDTHQTAHLAERTFLRHERSIVQSRGQAFRDRLALRERQAWAGRHEIPAGSRQAGRSQQHVNGGRLPQRELVVGDKDYLGSIMGDTRFQPTQPEVFVDTINGHVRTILQQGRFPASGNNRPVMLHEVSPGRFVVRDGRHRLVASEIASRLTGRPLLPRDVVPGSGLEPIIPAEHLLLTKAGDKRVAVTRSEKSWSRLGVQ